MRHEKLLDIQIFIMYNNVNRLPIFQQWAAKPYAMARDEARHGKAFKGLLERYFK